jgi:predicted PurR-regulated permease PerM
VYRQLLGASFYRQTQRICHCIDYYFNLDDGTVYNFCEKQLQNLESESTTLLTGKAGKTLMQCISGSLHFFMLLVIITISMIILVKELKPLHKSYQNSTFFPVVHRILVRLKESGLTYLKAEGIILLSNWLVCSLGLFLIHNPYFFLLGLGIAVFDAFPVLGSGLIFIPWGIYHFFDQNYYYAAILITTYLITLFTRELLEAKLIGRGLGLNPFIMTAAIFIGIELFGVCGIFLGPLAIVLIQAILSVTDASPAKINKTE